MRSKFPWWLLHSERWTLEGHFAMPQDGKRLSPILWVCQFGCFPSSYPAALELVASGRIDVKPLITHTYTLEETLQAFQRAKTGEGGAIKVCRGSNQVGIVCLWIVAPYHAIPLRIHDDIQSAPQRTIRMWVKLLKGTLILNGQGARVAVKVSPLGNLHLCTNTVLLGRYC